MSNRWWWPWNILKYFSRTRHGGLDCPDAVSYKSLLLPRLASWSWMLWRSWLSMLGLLLWSLHRGSCWGKDACQLTSRLYLSMRCEWILEMLTNYFFPALSLLWQLRLPHIPPRERPASKLSPVWAKTTPLSGGKGVTVKNVSRINIQLPSQHNKKLN